MTRYTPSEDTACGPANLRVVSLKPVTAKHQWSGGGMDDEESCQFLVITGDGEVDGYSTLGDLVQGMAIQGVSSDGVVERHQRNPSLFGQGGVD